MAKQIYDVLIKGAVLFDGSGQLPKACDVAVSNGKITCIAPAIASETALQIIDGTGKYLIPGLLDIHTHFDLEVEIAPGLSEAVRHGTTSVVVANCSLGLAFGAQRSDGIDPIVDCFARVENVPKHVLSKVADQVSWGTSAAYLDHLDHLALGPNIAAMIPHSMLRIEAMGLEASITRDPSPAELAKMETLLEAGMNEGYVGFSTDALPFHYIANQHFKTRRIPGQYGRFSEIKRLTDVVRSYGRVWQATPPKDSPLNVIRMFALTCGRLFGKPLKITAVAALDVYANKGIVRLGRLLSRLLNAPFLGGHFRLQALAAPFKVWGEGPITPLFEEIPELRLLNECDVDDRAARQKIYDDPLWQRAFLKMWRKGKSGVGLARLKRLLRREDFAISRDPAFMMVERAPIGVWQGESFADLLKRLQDFQAGQENAARDDAERQAFERFPPIKDDADLFLHLLRFYDTDLVWYEVSANRDPSLVKELLFDPKLLPGFNDSGAHLVNMAFYDCNLRGLKLALEDGIEAFSHMVHRLTVEPAEFFNLDVGRIEEGVAADLVLIDPNALRAYDGEAGVKRIYREDFEHHQLVNRSDGVVNLVLINGQIAWRGNEAAPALGQTKMGRVLRADHCAGTFRVAAIAAE